MVQWPNTPFLPLFDSCRLARQVKEFAGWAMPAPAAELLHLPGKPAGVEDKTRR
jgi:hypothetical protein